MINEEGYVIEERFSEWQKKPVRTIIVNCRSKYNSQRSIAGALKVANPYDRIELVGGEYLESLMISSPLELVSAEGEEASIITRGSCITITNDIPLYFQNLTMVSKGKTILEAGLVLMAGNITINRCNINSMLAGGSAIFALERCNILDSVSGYGLQVKDDAGGFIHDSTISSHNVACTYIETRAELLITDSIIYQYSGQGNVMVFTGINNGSLSCQNVCVEKCRIYVSSQYKKNLKDSNYSPNTKTVDGGFSAVSCVMVSAGASPKFLSNDLLEGEIGFFFEGMGCAKLEGNSIFKQRSCGILTRVDKGLGNFGEKQALLISGNNVIEGCHIGIDVQSAGTFFSDQEAAFSNPMPNTKEAFQWIPNLSDHNIPEPKLIHDAIESRKLVMLEGQLVSYAHLNEYMYRLARLVLSAYPLCLSLGISSIATNYGSASNPISEVLGETLGLSTATISPEGAPEGKRDFAMLLGTGGVNITKTKFSNCTLCAIRFSKNGYGVVEDCIFEDSGTTAIIVDSGAHPLITACRFLRSKGHSITVGNFANPLIFGNEINGGLTDGIHITALGRGLICGNMISCNTQAGIHIEGVTHTLICANSITKNKLSGLRITKSGTSLIFNNLFASNIGSHIICTTNSHPTIAFNKMLMSASIGIKFDNCSTGYVLKNQLDGSDVGISVELDADPYVEGNVISKCKNIGIVASNNGQGTFSHNIVTESSSSNISVTEGSNPTFRENVISKSLYVGIVVSGEGQGIFEHNTISENAVANAIVADKHTEPTFVRNVFASSSSGCGIICSRGCNGTFIRNSVFDNKMAGVYLIHEANPTFRANNINREVVGILVTENSKGKFSKNTVTGIYGSGCIVQRSSDPLFEENCISSCKLSGLLIPGDGFGEFIKNDIFENKVGIQLGTSLGTSELDINTALVKPAENITVGPQTIGSTLVSCVRSKSLTKESALLNMTNTFTVNKLNAMKKNHAILKENIIHKNLYCGVLLETEANGLLANNEICENADYGILADMQYSDVTVAGEMEKRGIRIAVESRNYGGGAATISCNRIHNHLRANISIFKHEKNCFSFEDNEIYDASIGFYIGNNSSLQKFCGNKIYKCLDGIFADSGGKGFYTDNLIEDCLFTGVYISDKANPQIMAGNQIQKCHLCGVLVDREGKGKIANSSIKHCTVGVIVFSGTPSYLSYYKSEAHSAGTRGSASVIPCSPLFEDNLIEENETHGVLVLTVPSGAALRATLKQQVQELEIDKRPSFSVHSPPVTEDLDPNNARAFPEFVKNTIQRNRNCGVYHDSFVHWSMNNTDALLAETLSDKSNTNPLLRATATFSQQTLSVVNSEPEESDNLASSRILSTDAHFSQRRENQVSFIENTITQSSIGVCVGRKCHPFLLRNRIVSNVFFGVVLRANSRATFFGCEISENGIAGLYACKESSGIVSDSMIRSNNRLCRPQHNLQEGRTTEEVFFPSQLSQHCSHSVAIESGATHLESTSKSYEHLTRLREIHSYSFYEATRIMFEFISIPSNSMNFASGTVPMKSAAGCENSAIPEYVTICTSDGGIGAWVEEYSRTEIRNCGIEQNQHVGVFMGSGILDHHESARFPRRPPDINGKLVSNAFHTLPEFASNQFGALFARTDLCVTTEASLGRIRVTNSQKDSSLPISIDTRAQLGSENDNKQPVNDSEVAFNVSVVSGCRILRNGDGIILQLSQLLTVSGTGTTSRIFPLLKSNNIAPKRRESVAFSNTVFPSSEEISEAMVKRSKELLNNTCSPTESIESYPFLIEGNIISSNLRHGIISEFIVNVDCKDHIPDRARLINHVSEEYTKIASAITFGKAPKMGNLPFQSECHPFNLTHAHVLENQLYHNTKTQMEVTSRYVCIAGDNSKTLILMNHFASPSASTESSQVMCRIPMIASITQFSSPGVLLLSNNTFRDSRHGLRISGLVGGNSLILRENTIINFSEEGILFDGHLACATVGEKNVFERNGTAIWIASGPSYSDDPEDLSDSSTISISRGQYIHILGNYFYSSVRNSVYVASNGTIIPVLYRNEFQRHAQGTAGIFISTLTSLSFIFSNSFRDNYTGMIVCKQEAQTDEFTRSQKLFSDGPLSLIVTMEGNHFSSNYIGALVCDGCKSSFKNNLFDRNVRAGMEIVDPETQVNLQGNIFEDHCYKEFISATANENNLAHGATGSNSLAVDMSYPPDGVIVFKEQRFRVQIGPDNSISQEKRGTRIFSSGLILASGTKTSGTQCLFRRNDVGLDAIHDLHFALKENGQKSSITESIFDSNRYAGVLSRGGYYGKLSTSSSSPSKKPNLSDLTKSLANTVQVQTAPIVLSSCYFYDNQADEEAGDAVCVSGGAILCKDSLFHGTVHGLDSSFALFFNNTFSGKDEKDTPTGAFFHSGTNIRLEGNTFFHRKVGLYCLPDSWGHASQNSLFRTKIGVLAAPSSNAYVSQNRIIMAKDCGVLAFGGVIAENTICCSPTGAIIQNSAEYDGPLSTHNSDKQKDSNKLLFSSNIISSCDEEGILVAGEGNIEGNMVLCCKNGINVIYTANASPIVAAHRSSTADATQPKHSASTESLLPTVRGNFVYDNINGIVMSAGSSAQLIDNDIFDNKTTGFLALERSQSLLQGNRISSALDTGAIEMASDAQVQNLQNTIKNQFSPSYKRGLQSSRIKEREKEAEVLEKDIDNMKSSHEQLLEKENHLKSHMEFVLSTIQSIQSGSILEIPNSSPWPHSGAPSRSFRRGTDGLVNIIPLKDGLSPVSLPGTASRRRSGANSAGNPISHRKARKASGSDLKIREINSSNINSNPSNNSRKLSSTATKIKKGIKKKKSV